MTYFRSQEVADITGLSLRQLQWMDETGLVKPQIKKKWMRLYSEADISRLVIIAQLQLKTISLQRIRVVMKSLATMPTARYIAVSGGSKPRVFVSDSPREIIAEIARWKEPAALIETMQSLMEKVA